MLKLTVDRFGDPQINKMEGKEASLSSSPWATIREKLKLVTIKW